jgi:hypothetical protein
MTWFRLANGGRDMMPIQSHFDRTKNVQECPTSAQQSSSRGWVWIVSRLFDQSSIALFGVACQTEGAGMFRRLNDMPSRDPRTPTAIHP